jgi:hypothetical protein
MANPKADTAWWADQPQPQPIYGRSYDLTSRYISMRDGERLAIAGADKDNFQLFPPEPPHIEILRTQTSPSHILLPIS